MPDTMPRKVAQRSDLGLGVFAVGAMTMFMVHNLGLVGWHNTLMVYMAFMSGVIACGVSSALARCHVAIAQAFSAGVRLGRAQGVPPEQPRHRAPLRVVD